MMIKGIVLKKSYSSFLVVSISCAILYYMIIVWIHFYKRKINKTITKVIPYKELKLPEMSDKKLTRIIEYISIHYSEEGLVLSKLSNDIGIPARDISEYIKKEYKLNFKQYLNGIRMHEAKRLLKNSTFSVSEIAYKIGFSNVTHFNRTFRQYCDCSPLAYRTNKKQFD
jgi:YesN/AraC family two-component response regulator